METHAAYVVHGPGEPFTTLVLDSPHSGTELPADFRPACRPELLRDGEDCFVDRLWAGAADQGVPLLAARFPRTYIDANRHEADHDPELLAEPWPGELRASGKAAIGKALVWRTLDDGTPIYARRLTVAEVAARIEGFHRPYHARLRELLDAAHARFGVVHHVNCHSMNPVAGLMGEGGAGSARADVVLGDRDGSTCHPDFTAFVGAFLRGKGLDVRVNDPYKGVELVRAYSAPGPSPRSGRHSLQLELNKRLYMDMASTAPHAGFAPLQRTLMALIEALRTEFAA